MYIEPIPQSPDQNAVINNSIKQNLQDKRKIDKNYTVAIDGKEREGVEFMKDTKKNKFPNYKGLKVGNMDSVPQNDLNEFLETSHPAEMDHVYLNNNGKSVKPVCDSMCKTLKSVKKEIFLENMTFDKNTLAKVIENSAHAEKVVFKDCKLDIDNTFKGTNSDFKFKTLNMYDCFKDSTVPFDHFVNGMKGTSLKNHNFELQLSAKDFGDRVEKRTKDKGKGGKKKKNDSDDNEYLLELDIKEGVIKELEDIYKTLCLNYRIKSVGDYIYSGQVVGKEIAGHGIYKAKKGKGQRIHYCRDLVHQYEEVTYDNGASYKGYVRDGYKHGIGIYDPNPKNGDEDDKVYGLWIHDEQRVKFTPKEVSEINRGNGAKLEYFKNNKRHVKHIEEQQNFAPPPNFKLIMDEVEARINEMKRYVKLNLFYIGKISMKKSISIMRPHKCCLKRVRNLKRKQGLR